MDADTHINDGMRHTIPSPLIIWATDAVSQRLAQGFQSWFAAEVGEAPHFAIFAPQEDALAEFKLLAGQLVERAQGKGQATELQIVLLSCSWAPGWPENAELLQQISKTLGTLATGNRFLSIALVLPPRTIGDAEKQRVFEAFQYLEDLVGEIRFLSAVFAYQLSIELYEQLANEGKPDPHICELIFRQCADADLTDTIRRHGFSAVGNHLAAAGRKACYSALGMHRSRFLLEELHRYVMARFAHDLYTKGLNNIENLSAEQRDAIQARAEGILNQSTETYEARFRDPDLPTFELPPINPDDQGDEGAAGEIRHRIREESAKLIAGTRQGLASDLAKCEKVLREDFQAFLHKPPAFLAGGRAYWIALAGRPADISADGTTQPPTGLVALRDHLCRTPLHEALGRYLSERVSAFLTVADLSPPTDVADHNPLELLEAFRTKLQQAGAGSPMHQSYRFLADALAALQEHLRRPQLDMSTGQHLLDQLISRFGAAAAELSAVRLTIQDALEQAASDLRQLRAEYGWFTRAVSRRGEYQRQRSTIRSRRAELRETAAAIDRCFPDLHGALRDILWAVLWPHLFRLIALEDVAAAVGELSAEFHQYVASMQAPIVNRWEAAQHYTEIDSLHETTVLRQENLAQIYHDHVGSVSWSEYVRRVLAFIPRHPPPYRGCRDLSDHYTAGAEMLLLRTRDFAADLFAPVADLDVFDVIATQGGESAWQYLSTAVGKTAHFPEFSSAMLPRVEHEGVMSRVCVVRASAAVLDKLQRGYLEVFGENTQWLPIGNREMLDITTCTFGFPAFVLHILQDARDLARKSPETARSSDADLWPQ